MTASIFERFITDSGRTRLRRVDVDPRAELHPVSDADRRIWATTRDRLRQLAGAMTYDVWLAGLTAIAVSRADDALLLAAPPDQHRWVASRHQRLIEAVSRDVGRRMRMASDRELALYHVLTGPSTPTRVPDRQEAI